MMLLCVVGASGCADVYPIGGATHGDAGADPSEGRFAVPLDASGTSGFGERALGDVAPLLLLRGEDARSDAWPARIGPSFSSSEGEVGLRGPFVDGTRGARGRYVGSIATPASIVIELVLAAPVDATSAELISAPLRVALDTNEGGSWTVGDDRIEAPIGAGAWQHVVIARSPDATRVFVNARELATLAGADATYEGVLEVGGAAAIAWLSVSERPAVLDVPERFAALTGTLARTAAGRAAPLPLARESDAYVDLVQAGVRRLHRVGPRWPRIACRPNAPADALDALGSAVVCGYLAETESSATSIALVDRPLLGLSVSSATAPGPGDAIGVERVDGIGEGEHHVTLPFGADDDQVLSFFVRPAAADVSLELDLGLRGRASFSFDGAPVVEGGLRAHDERWGDGWHRVWIVSQEAGEPDAIVRVLRGGARTFAASGPLLFVAGARVESNRRDPSSLGPRETDVLAYATSGNVPRDRASISARVLVDAWTRLHDGTIVHFASDPQIVNLYYSLDTRVTFAATGGPFEWNLHGASVRDGRVIDVEASWSAEGVSLRARETLDTDDVPAGLDAVETFDRFVVGTGGPSGEIHGLISGLRIE
ncbi:MAG: hypothetical protein MUE69_03470 [Myxococcota bacterium]|nr:hypothetical protein [Myxococcota bacterium]